MLRLSRCMHCFAANASEVRFDKKGRPYVVCKLCWTKAFFQSLEPLRGVAVVPALVESARCRGPVFLKPDVDGLLAWVRRMLRSTQPPPTK